MTPLPPLQLDAALKRLHTEDNNKVTAQLTMEVSGSLSAIQLLKRLGFHFQARGGRLMTPYIVFPHWNTDDLLIPSYDALRAVAGQIYFCVCVCVCVCVRFFGGILYLDLVISLIEVISKAW